MNFTNYDFSHWPTSFENLSLGDLFTDRNITDFINMSRINLSDHITNILDNHQGNLSSKREPDSILIPVTICYVIIFIAGVLGNVITCTVISRNKTMHTATNYYLFNLAISDLLLLLSGLPQDTYNIWFPTNYPLNQSLCILIGMISETSSNATVLTITSFTVERYIAICHPFRQHAMSKLSRAVKFILVIWTVAFCLAIPQAMQFGVVPTSGGHSCTVEAGLTHAFVVSSFLFFVGPMVLICVLYVLIGVKLRKSKLLQGVKHRELGRGMSGQTRVIRMLIAVVVAFFLCWAPFHTQRIMAIYGKTGAHHNSLYYNIYTIINYASGVLYFLSTCINPLLYNIMSHKFRDAFKSTLARNCVFQGSEEYIRKNTYSVLSKYHGNGSLRLNPQTGDGRSDKYLLKRDSNELTTGTDCNNSIKSNNKHKIFVRSSNPSFRSTASQLTLMTSISVPPAQSSNTDVSNGVVPRSNGSIKSAVPLSPHRHPNEMKTILSTTTTLSSIAEKLRRGTKRVLLFKGSVVPTSSASSTLITSTSQPMIKPITDGRPQFATSYSIDDHTNTISNSSLREVDDEEFDSTDLVKYMAEINCDIR